eukprot:gnl/MRDRNA2_/MRDRNA2_80101_c0_seq1.p1 gnl/MRDRNA2_/MRDRNA2_80101_c0~~gnl/MRDRNA2_/MRDRNA2_80101_c0_seq1.p1  ORF type:complete len:4787 (+),score=748.07 gnl/MRDRNA2_/MRDRNA2_80101_c0_seq1:123-14483(+)
MSITKVKALLVLVHLACATNQATRMDEQTMTCSADEATCEQNGISVDSQSSSKSKDIGISLLQSQLRMASLASDVGAEDSENTEDVDSEEEEEEYEEEEMVSGALMPGIAVDHMGLVEIAPSEPELMKEDISENEDSLEEYMGDEPEDEALLQDYGGEDPMDLHHENETERTPEPEQFRVMEKNNGMKRHFRLPYSHVDVALYDQEKMNAHTREHLRMHDKGKPKVTGMKPKLGSIEGGTTISFYGVNLYESHEKMHGGDFGEVSSLQPPLRIFIGNEDVEIECPMQFFESRSEVVKCVTPPLEAKHQDLMDQELSITVVKRTPEGKYTVVQTAPDTQLRFQYFTGVTPSLHSVTPQVAGPGDTITIHAWACDGIFKATPVELVSVKKEEKLIDAGGSKDPDSLVVDAEHSWGHLCENSEKDMDVEDLATNQAASEADTNLPGAPKNLGAQGLVSKLWQQHPMPPHRSAKWWETVEFSHRNLGDWNWIQNYTSSTKHNRIWVSERPYLASNSNSKVESELTWYLQKNDKPALALHNGWLKITTNGTYNFNVKCIKYCWMLIDAAHLFDTATETDDKLSWATRGEVTAKMTLGVGWHRLTVYHAYTAGRAGYMRGRQLEVSYAGPDTDEKQISFPARVLRAGMTKKVVQGYDKEVRQEVRDASLVPAKWLVHAGKNIKRPAAKCKPRGDKAQKLFEFSTRVPRDLEPGYYNLKFHDYHHGASIESENAKFTVGAGKTHKATLRIVPKVEEVLQLPSGDLHVRGAGLDHLPAVKKADSEEVFYNGKKYKVTNSSQDHVDLEEAGDAPGTETRLGSRGLGREFWLQKRPPETQESLMKPPTYGRADRIKTVIEEDDGSLILEEGNEGFSEELKGVLVPPFSGQCRFRMQGTQTSSTDTEVDARLYIKGDGLDSEMDDWATPPIPFLYTNLAHERVSTWLTLEKGKAYPIRLQRTTGLPSEDTGVDGWDKFGLECKDMEGGDGNLNPPISQVVTLSGDETSSSLLQEDKTLTALLTHPGKWTTAVHISASGTETTIGEAEFNAKFRDCPAVKYKRDGVEAMVYIWVNPDGLPDDMNAYEMFTKHWSPKPVCSISKHKDWCKQKESHKFLMPTGLPYKLFSTEADARRFKPRAHNHRGEQARGELLGEKWGNSLDVDGGKGIGFPGVPRIEKMRTWGFKMPEAGTMEGIEHEASLELYSGENCPSHFGKKFPPGSQTTFSTADSAPVIEKKLKGAGMPVSKIDIIKYGTVEKLDLTDPKTYKKLSWSSARDDKGPEKAIDADMSSKFQTIDNDRQQPYWSIKLADTYDIHSIKVCGEKKCRSTKHGITVTVDGSKCAGFEDPTSNVKFRCAARGSEVKVACTSCSKSGGYYKGFAIPFLEIWVHSKEGTFSGDVFGMQVMYNAGAQARIAFSSDAGKITTQETSSGSRYWSQTTDYWFREHHPKAQVTFGNWRDYICDTGSKDGCTPFDTDEPPEPVGALLQSHAARQHVPGTRRAPHKRWRLPPRYHTPESLEGLRRTVLGEGIRPNGWKETESLLQKHRGQQHKYRHSQSKSGGGDVDPRKSKDFMRWSDPKSWGGGSIPTGENTDIVFIPEGKTAMLDMSVRIHFWVIEGNLIWDMSKDIMMEAEVIIVNGGNLLVGSEEEPYLKNGQVLLHGHWHSYKLPLCGTKSIFETRGVVEFHGEKISKTWVELETTAMPGSTSLKLRQAVPDWKPGSLIVVAGSDQHLQNCRLDRRDKCQVEERYVSKMSKDGKTITLDRPLVYRHLAEEYDHHFPKSYCKEKPELCFKTQVRSEVGLITRNLKIKGANYDEGTGPPGSEGYGAHLMHCEKAKYTYVEMYWMGQANQLGRYPLHLHLTGVNSFSKIEGNAIHRTFNRGVTIHGTHQALVKDNVLYNHMSHGFFIEDGNEHDNIFEGNLCMMTHISMSMLVSDQTPASFWIRNPQNYFRNNHAAGGSHFGFWFDTEPLAMNVEWLEFNGNVAHSYDKAMWVEWDGREGCRSPDNWQVSIPVSDSDYVDQVKHKNYPECTGKRQQGKILSFTTWGNIWGLVSFECGHFHYENHRSVNDKRIGLLVWGHGASSWPDPTNNFEGVAVMNSVYKSDSPLRDIGWHMENNVGMGWDDTLFITGTQFVGPVAKGHLRSCDKCIGQEGGYHQRTSKLGWHDGAGTAASPRVEFKWQFASHLFDFDGTLSGHSECKEGCYVHSKLVGGMFRSPVAMELVKRPVLNTDSSLLMANTTRSKTLSERAHQKEVKIPAKDWDISGPPTLKYPKCDDDLTSDESVQMAASPSLAGRGPQFGKITKKQAGNPNAWVPYWQPLHADKDQYLQFNLGTPKWITYIETYGAGDKDNWVKSYRVSWSLDGDNWENLGRVLEGNHKRARQRTENPVIPFKALFVRLHPETWHLGIAMAARLFGCSGATQMKKMCVNGAYLHFGKTNCRDAEKKYQLGRSHGYKDHLEAMWYEWCNVTEIGAVRSSTKMNAQEACCACGGGEIMDLTKVERSKGLAEELFHPWEARKKTVNGGTGYFPPEQCQNVARTGGMICHKATRMESMTVKGIGAWHATLPMKVQTDWGYSNLAWVECYQHYEFTLIQDARHMIIPPYTPASLKDITSWSADVSIKDGDRFVMQVETIHNPTGYQVGFGQAHHFGICDENRQAEKMRKATKRAFYGQKMYNCFGKIHRGERWTDAKAKGVTLSMEKMLERKHASILGTGGVVLCDHKDIPGKISVAHEELTGANAMQQCFCDFTNERPLFYTNEYFWENEKYLKLLKSSTEKHAAATLGLDLELDMYKVAHLPLLDAAHLKNSGGMFGYLMANESYVVKYWYPGTLSVLMTPNGIFNPTPPKYDPEKIMRGENGKGFDGLENYDLQMRWGDGKLKEGELLPTHMVGGSYALPGGFSRSAVKFKWSRWNFLEHPEIKEMPIWHSHLERVVGCGRVTPASLEHLGLDGIKSAVSEHEAVKSGRLTVSKFRKFKWSEWPEDLGGKPKGVTGGDPLEDAAMGVGNVTIEPDWEVELDEDVDFINKLNISGVLKFADKAGCCKLVARYIFIGPFVGRMEIGSESQPFTKGKAHILLKGHPMTPYIKDPSPFFWHPGEQIGLKSKYIAVQGTLSMVSGVARTKMYGQLKTSVEKGDTKLILNQGNFEPGDIITIGTGGWGPGEKKRVVSVKGAGSSNVVLQLDSGLEKEYTGADHTHEGRKETQGWFATPVGVVSGGNIVIEPEDTPGVPMCDKSELEICPYSSGLPDGMSLHDFAKETRYYEKKTGTAAHPNCRPCLAVTDMKMAAAIRAFAYFDVLFPDFLCPKTHGTILAEGVMFVNTYVNLYEHYPDGEEQYPTAPKGECFDHTYNKRKYNWYDDPVWEELSVTGMKKSTHGIRSCSFNLTNVKGKTSLMADPPGVEKMSRGGYIAMTNGGEITNNVFLGKGFWEKVSKEKGQVFLGKASDIVDGELQHVVGWIKFTHNFLSGAELVTKTWPIVRHNIFTNTALLDGGSITTSHASGTFTDNIVHGPTESGVCIKLKFPSIKANPAYRTIPYGVADNIIHSCDKGVIWRSVSGVMGVLTRMKIANCKLGIWYHQKGKVRFRKNTRFFKATDTTIYARKNGKGVGFENPVIHSTLGWKIKQAPPMGPNWGMSTPPFTPPFAPGKIGNWFQSHFYDITFIGFKRESKGTGRYAPVDGVAIAMGESYKDSLDADFHPVYVKGLKFEDMEEDSRVYFKNPRNRGDGVRKCLQIDCGGIKNAAIHDEDGSLMGSKGVVISTQGKEMYETLYYVDPMGFATTEDLIPYPQRYDRYGAAIPFPKGVPHGDPNRGDLIYECKQGSKTSTGKRGCDVLFMQGPGTPQAGQWLPSKGLVIANKQKIYATREDGGLIRLDPIHHGWNFATGWVRTNLCTLLHNDTVNITETTDRDEAWEYRLESQHARRYGRAAPGEFGKHINTSRQEALKGPVYTEAGIWKKGCKHNEAWNTYTCPGGGHRLLLLEVLDNVPVRRRAPVTVEVNDQYKPQGGTLNILTDHARGKNGFMQQPRRQVFHSLGVVGLRHNVYFASDPPKHIRMHFDGFNDEGIVICMYYGVPNQVIGYVDGKRVEPWVTPTWDNIHLPELKSTMPHGTYVYDRIGVETGRPGYLYVVVWGGGRYIDFKITHKVTLTTKVKVDAGFGKWDQKDGPPHFYDKGTDGLTKNLALLLGTPPSRVKILGEGSATKGTFWNEETTTKEMAEHMHDKTEKDKSLSHTKMEEWVTTPGYKGMTKTPHPDQGAEKAVSLLQMEHEYHDQRHVRFLQRFNASRHGVISAALSHAHVPSGKWRSTFKIGLLTQEEALAVGDHVEEIAREQAAQYMEASLVNMQMTQQEREANAETFAKEFNKNRVGYLMVEAACEDGVAGQQGCSDDENADCEALEDTMGNDLEKSCETAAEALMELTSEPTEGYELKDPDSLSMLQAAANLTTHAGANHHRDHHSVGDRGGICTCPDGQVYPVGELKGSDCRKMACEGGVASECGSHNSEGAGKKVTCAPMKIVLQQGGFSDRQKHLLNRGYSLKQIEAAHGIQVVTAAVDDVPRMAVPTGWKCTVVQWHDGVCDCDCGIWDPACDDVQQVYVIRSTTEEIEGHLELLDEDQSEEVMARLDENQKFGNNNGIIDGNEMGRMAELISRPARGGGPRPFTSSSLHGVAQKIMAAQEEISVNGRNGQFVNNFAIMDAVATESCVMASAERDPDASTAVSYTPVCVKDNKWETLVAEPVGRCALLPKLAKKSQCKVPGGSLYDGNVCGQGEDCHASAENSWDYNCVRVAMAGMPDTGL